LRPIGGALGRAIILVIDLTPGVIVEVVEITIDDLVGLTL